MLRGHRGGAGHGDRRGVDRRRSHPPPGRACRTHRRSQRSAAPPAPPGQRAPRGRRAVAVASARPGAHSGAPSSWSGQRWADARSELLPRRRRRQPFLRPRRRHPRGVTASYHLAARRHGFSVPVPDGWTRQVKRGEEIVYVDPNGLAGLQDRRAGLRGHDPLQHWKAGGAADEEPGGGVRAAADAEHPLAWTARPPSGSSPSRARPVTSGPSTSASWEPGGQEYAVYLSAPSARWGYRQACLRQRRRRIPAGEVARKPIWSRAKHRRRCLKAGVGTASPSQG